MSRRISQIHKGHSCSWQLPGPQTLVYMLRGGRLTRVDCHLHGQTRSVLCLVKWFEKFRTDKFRPGIAFTICTNQFHLPENGREGLKLVSKMALKKWNTNLRLEYSIWKNKTTFSDVPLLPEFFRSKDPKSRVPFTSQPDFPQIFVNGKQP